MVTLTGVLSSIFNAIKMLVPQTIDPIMFYATFLLTTVLIFVVIQKIHFFKDMKPIQMIVSIILAYFTASSAFVTIIIAKLFPNIGMAIMAMLGLMMVIIFISPKSLDGDKGLKGTPIWILLFFILTIWLTWSFAAPELEKTGLLSLIKTPGGFTISDEDVSVVIGVIIIGGLMYFIFSGPSKPSDPNSRWGKMLDWFGGNEF